MTDDKFDLRANNSLSPIPNDELHSNGKSTISFENTIQDFQEFGGVLNCETNNRKTEEFSYVKVLDRYLDYYTSVHSDVFTILYDGSYSNRHYIINDCNTRL